MDLICSDLHANIHALNRLNRYIGAIKPSKIVILGDIVGYGAFPNEACDWIGDLQSSCYLTYVIHGNHDYAVRDLGYIRHFNDRAAQAAQWTIDQLTPRNKEWLATLPPQITDESVEYVHGSPTGFDDYILNGWDVHNAFAKMTGKICFFGHTHLPIIISALPDASGRVTDFEVVETAASSGDMSMYGHINKWYLLDSTKKYLINPGSVGQPRDRNSRLSFCLFDPDAYAVKFVRLNYDWEAAKDAIYATDGGLPTSLGDRLLEGR
jgi:predicted phosphodiesterase